MKDFGVYQSMGWDQGGPMNLIKKADDERLNVGVYDNGPVGLSHALQDLHLAHASLRAALEKLDYERKDFSERFCSHRGIETPCTKCGGGGNRLYPNTTTWSGGFGGQAITADVCDVCWGSGDEKKPWANLRVMRSKFKILDADLIAALAQLVEKEEELKGYEAEKFRRMYYQGIVYAVCLWIDSIEGRRAGNGVVCGTYETPSEGVGNELELIGKILEESGLLTPIRNLHKKGDKDADR